jgi:hypothetical protein
MTNKSTVPRPAEPRVTLQDDLKTAYQVHTLVQILTVRLAAAPHWTPMIQVPFPPGLH